MTEEQTGDLQNALADYERAIARAPKDSFALAGAARVSAKLTGRSGDTHVMPRGTSSWGTIYPSNSRGDVFAGGAW